jgi:competence protein ComEA
VSERPDPGFWGDDRARRVRVPRPTADGFDVLRDRFHAWRGDARGAVVVLVVIAVVAGFVWYRIGASGGDAPATSVRRTASSNAAAPSRSETTRVATPTSTARGPKVVVHIAGAVTRPGVLELDPGARVIDAVEAAGGALPEADLDRLNLAAKLADGQRVLVERVGAPPAPTDATGAAPDDGAAGAGPVNVNTATQAQLEELPGIGPVLAEAIIDERERRGGFRSVNELRDVRGIGEKRFEDLRSSVTV